MSAYLENSMIATGLEKIGFILIPKKGSAKECTNYHMIVFILHASKLCSKSFKLGFNSTWTENFQIYKLGLEKAEEPEIKLPTFAGSQRKRISAKHLILLHWLC